MPRCNHAVSSLSLVTLALSTTILPTASSPDSNWPMFRGPRAPGIGNDAPLPYSWNASSGARVKWRAPIPGLSHASPIVWGDRVYC